MTTGGVSVGDYDFVKSSFTALGGEMELWRVSMKPGKPFGFGSLGNSRWFGLPGNPVSAVVTAILFLLPAIRRAQGQQDPLPVERIFRMSDRLSNPGDRRHYVRVQLDAKSNASNAGLQASHALSSLRLAQGLVPVEPGDTLEVGTMVSGLLL